MGTLMPTTMDSFRGREYNVFLRKFGVQGMQESLQFAVDASLDNFGGEIRWIGEKRTRLAARCI